MVDTYFCDYLTIVIRECYFEPGKWTNADSLFLDRLNLKLLVNLSDEAFEELKYITENNQNDAHILEGVLHILSNYDTVYDSINKYALPIITLCSKDTSDIVQDGILQCVENWNSPDFIPILNRMDITTNWLKRYRDDILENIQNSKAENNINE